MALAELPFSLMNFEQFFQGTSERIKGASPFRIIKSPVKPANAATNQAPHVLGPELSVFVQQICRYGSTNT
jgi:hypothetical protein